ncbi:unnamed protein product [Ceutorhynchus assimilis]|uniref:NAD(P)-binding domain-containing protein n=1 Tax=Ceutorhynchus assimilis TaxID=467358 RepID=A0A9N9QI39_9CUCU|nr:unnamed protein product [Ceutorhynchus assimilis]
MEKIAIFGATGMTGLCVIEAALNKGLKPKILVRDSSKVPDGPKTQLGIIEGNVLNYPDVLKTVQDTNGVIVTLGTRNSLEPTTDMSDGLKNIIRAMKECNIEVISVCLSAFLFHDPGSSKVPAIFHDVTADHKRMFDLLMESGLKYVAAFPPHIADEPARGYQVEHDKYISRVITKYDLGQFLVDSLTLPEHFGHIIGLASK